jgi:hypothetical protein
MDHPVGDQDIQNAQPSAGQTIGDSDILPAGAGLDTVSSSGNMAFVGGSDNDTDITSGTDEFSAGREGSPRLFPLVTAVATALIAVIASHTAHRAMNAQAAPEVMRAAWSGFEQPVGHLCTFGSRLRERFAAVVMSGRFETGFGRASPIYSLVFTANDGTPEITKLGVAVDDREVAHFDVESHVPVASGASAVVALNIETLGTLFEATDNGKVLHVLVLPARVSYDFDLSGFATAADVFTGCMLHNAP